MGSFLDWQTLGSRTKSAPSYRSSWAPESADHLRSSCHSTIKVTPAAEEACTRHCYASVEGFIIGDMRDSRFFRNNNAENKA
jgi:hypothetical protein